jgi:DNA processing protein
LITARYGLEHNREVFAIPGSIHNPLSRGCHALIKEGATLVEASKDIMDQLQGWLMTRPSVSEPTQYPCSNLAPDLSDDEHRLWQLIGFEPTGLEQLIAATRLSTGEVLSALMGLELKGLIESYEGGYQRLS